MTSYDRNNNHDDEIKKTKRRPIIDPAIAVRLLNKRYNAGGAVRQQRNTEKQQFASQYRNNISKEFAKKLSKIHPSQTIFTTREPKSCLHRLMSSFGKDLKSHVVYELAFNGFESIYVGHTCRHITTRVTEHAKADSPMGKHAIELNGDKTAFHWTIFDQCGNQSKLMTLEALYTRTPKPTINMCDEYRTRELTLRA